MHHDRPQLPSSARQVESLTKLIEDAPRVLIFTHDNPDPDSMAGALCLSFLVAALGPARPRIAYGGLIGRAENRHMVEALEIPLWSVGNIKFRHDDVFITVDTQPGFGNNSLPPDARVVAVLDHHEQPTGIEAGLVDIRPDYGAVTTIATEYLVSAGLELDPRLATAICYGISSETQDLGREAAEADIAAYLQAFPVSNQPLLGRLHHPRRTPAFFADLQQAISAAGVLEDVLICHIPDVSIAETVAEMADMLMDVQGITWVLCTGCYGGELVLSLRTREPDACAGQLVCCVVGSTQLAGGHGMVAGGRIPLDEENTAEEVRSRLGRNLLEALGHRPNASLTPLTKLPGVPGTPGGGLKSSE